MRRFGLFGAALILAGATLLTFGTASAQTLPPLVTDYANYPDTSQAMLSDGCSAFVGLGGISFNVNGGTPVGALTDLPEVSAGDVLTMSWTGVSAECFGSAVSLVVKVAQQPVFQQFVDQFTPPGGYNVTTVTDNSPGSLSLTLPDLTSYGFGCAYQIDAIVGVPLAVVGPNGSDYSASVRGDDRRTTVFSWRNSAYSVCESTTTTSSTTSTSTTSTTTPTSSTTPSSTTSTTPGTVVSSTEPPVLVPQARALAATGRSPWPAMAGATGVLAGLVLVLASRRRSAHEAS